MHSKKLKCALIILSIATHPSPGLMFRRCFVVDRKRNDERRIWGETTPTEIEQNDLYSPQAIYLFRPLKIFLFTKLYDFKISKN
jgi:hypothetical protein